MAQLFLELALVMVVTFLVSLIMSRLKQPLLVGYILTGVLAGPIFFNFLTDKATYEVFAHIGVAFLLFIVGMQLNLKLVKQVGKVSVITGIGQIVFTTIIGFVLAYVFGYGPIQSLLIAIALTFSSTIIIVKLLSDTHGLEQLHGKISLGFLLVQDVVAVLVLMVLATFVSGASSIAAISTVLIKGLIAVVSVIFVGKYFLEGLLQKIAHQKETFFLFIIAWCFGIAILFQYLGFSLEIGALLAGVVLASTPYRLEVEGRIKPLRDFFIILFFVFLGTQLIPQPETALVLGEQWAYIVSTLGAILPDALLLSSFVLIGNPLIVFTLITRLKYSAKTAFLSGLTVSQISEFSIILALLAGQINLVSTSTVSLITLVAVITITCSTYLVVFGEKIYHKLEHILVRFQTDRPHDALQGVQGKRHDIGIFGFHRIGFHVLRAIQKTHHSFIVVDHDPRLIKKLKKRHVPAVFGDITSTEFLSEFDFKDMSLVVSTVAEFSASKLLLENYKSQNEKGIAILTAEHHEQALDLYERGADYVIIPQHLGGNHIEALIHEFNTNQERFIIEKVKHLKELQDINF